VHPDQRLSTPRELRDRRPRQPDRYDTVRPENFKLADEEIHKDSIIVPALFSQRVITLTFQIYRHPPNSISFFGRPTMSRPVL
jgi:hypothetical protein